MARGPAVLGGRTRRSGRGVERLPRRRDEREGADAARRLERRGRLRWLGAVRKAGAGADHFTILRHGVVASSGPITFADGTTSLAASLREVTVPFDQDDQATYSVCAADAVGAACCADPITPIRRACAWVEKCLVKGKLVVATPEDDPVTWRSDAHGRIARVYECLESTH